MSKWSISKGVTSMKMSHFDMKISKFSNQLIIDMHVVDDEKIKFPYCTSINNGQMKVKITFSWCDGSNEKNII